MIWQRYLFRELLKVFFLFLGSFFFLYAILDYSLHMQDFIINKQIQIVHTIIYYFYQFIKRADILIPLALLIATLKVLFALNTRGELVALQASGLSARQILRPFFLLATLCTLFNLASLEFFLPSSLNFLDRFREEHFKHSYRGNRKEPIHVVPLKDHSKLIYLTQNPTTGLFEDAYWLRSINEIWHMKTLTPDAKNPVGTFVDHLVRSREGQFEKTESFNIYQFSSFRWEIDPIGKGYVPFENRKISDLLYLAAHKAKTTAYEYPQILTYLLYKLIMPLLPFVMIFAVAPICFRSARSHPIFLTYSLSIFSFIAFTSMLDAALILGENRLVSPYIVTLLPFMLLSLGFGWKFAKGVR